jgi:UDP-N-acetylglucosamine acyltransferase
MSQISAQAIVVNPANLADDVYVGPFAYVGPEVRVGPGSRIENNVTIDGAVTIGRNNHVFPFAVIGQPADDSPAGPVAIGDDNKIREHVVISAGRSGQTRLGNSGLIMIGSYIGPDCQLDDRIILGNYAQLAERTVVEKFVWASAFTGTWPGTRIGGYTFTSGYAGIDRDAPPFAMVQGFPFKVRAVNTHNLKRCGFEEKTISQLKDAFRLLYDGSSSIADPEQARRFIDQPHDDPHVQALADFLARSIGNGRPVGGGV